MFRILRPISNSDILNYLSCQEPIEMTSINAQHKRCHHSEFQPVWTDGVWISGLIIYLPSPSSPLAKHLDIVTVKAKWPAFFFFHRLHIVLSSWHHCFSHLSSLRNWFKKICGTNPQSQIIFYGVILGNSDFYLKLIKKMSIIVWKAMGSKPLLHTTRLK